MMVFEHDFKKFPELTNAQMGEFGLTSPHKQITEDFRALVVKVHDGDTVTLRTDFRDFDFPIRLEEIDADELSEGGERQKEWLQKLIEGQKVDVLINSKNRVDKYGRLLGTIMFCGLNVAQEEILLGLAKPFGRKKEGEVPDINMVLSLKQWL